MPDPRSAFHSATLSTESNAAVTTKIKIKLFWRQSKLAKIFVHAVFFLIFCCCKYSYLTEN